MHLALLTSDFSVRSSGGIGTYVHTIANGLALRGHRVTVMSPRVGNRGDAGYQVLLVPSPDEASDDRRPSLARCFRDALIALHETEPIDVAEVTDFGLEGLAWLRDERCLASGVAMTLRMHTPDSLVCELNDEIRLADSAAVHALEGTYFRSALSVSAPSKAMARMAVERWGVRAERVTVIPNPIDTRRVVEPPPDPTQRTDALRIGFLGRLERRKGVFVLAEALQQLLPQHPRLTVDLIGADTRTNTDGSVGRQLRRLLEPWLDRVRFRGFLTGADLSNSLHAADVLCLPSLWENFPYSCLEAMAAGRPVIATQGSGFDEIIEHDVTGLLVPPNDATALAGSIEQLVVGGFRPPLERLTRQVARFDSTAVLPRLEHYYEGLIE